MSGHFEQKIGFDKEMQSAPITEAEAQAYLGDLLLHSHRTEAEAYLLKALELDPNLAMAHASLGMLRVYQGKAAEARQSLEKAVAANSQNYLIHYYYAFALSREGSGDGEIVTGLSPQNLNTMRDHLKKAIALRPDYPESYSLLAYVNLLTGSNLDESVQMLKRALATSPGRNDLLFMLAQVYMRKDEIKTAREMLQKLSENNSNPELREHARTLLAEIVANETERERYRASEKEFRSRPTPQESAQPEVSVSLDPSSYMRDALRKPQTGETQVQGTLVRIDCVAKGITLVVRAGERLLKVTTRSFEQMDITSFTSDAGNEITCGPRKPENNVIVTYAPAAARAVTDGVAKSLEFVPKDFKLIPTP
jgi:Tfp pilus assembly protein PilF